MTCCYTLFFAARKEGYPEGAHRVQGWFRGINVGYSLILLTKTDVPVGLANISSNCNVCVNRTLRPSNFFDHPNFFGSILSLLINLDSRHGDGTFRYGAMHWQSRIEVVPCYGPLPQVVPGIVPSDSLGQAAASLWFVASWWEPQSVKKRWHRHGGPATWLQFVFKLMRYCQWPSDGPSQVEPGLDLFGKRINDGKFQRSKGFDCCVQVAHLWWEAGSGIWELMLSIILHVYRTPFYVCGKALTCWFMWPCLQECQPIIWRLVSPDLAWLLKFMRTPMHLVHTAWKICFHSANIQSFLPSVPKYGT